MLALLGGCSAVPSSINPVEWWHGLQGGAIAEQRPPPPGADQAYPNLASVPAKPAAADLKLHQQIADSLVADRANAQYAAAQAPLADPSSPTASPQLFGRGTAPPPAPPASPDAAGASLAAATAPPAPPAAAGPASAPAPAGPGSGPSPPGKTAPASAGAPSLAPPPGADVAGPAAADGAAPPAFASAPPTPPDIAGAPAAAAAAAGSAASPKPPKTAAAPAEPKQVGATVPVGFPTGSAVLPSASRDALKQFAAQRKNAIVLVTGFGEAASPDPATQSGALTLALARAQAMAAALTKDGVPGYFIRVDGEANGRGGAARLVQ